MHDLSISYYEKVSPVCITFHGLKENEASHIGLHWGSD